MAKRPPIPPHHSNLFARCHRCGGRMHHPAYGRRRFICYTCLTTVPQPAKREPLPTT